MSTQRQRIGQARYKAIAYWQGADIGDLFGHEWPIRLDSAALDYLMDHDRFGHRTFRCGQVSVDSVRCFERYETLCDRAIYGSSYLGKHVDETLFTSLRKQPQPLPFVDLNPVDALVDDVTLESYIEFAQNIVDEINAMHRLYMSCLYDQRDTPIDYMFTVLTNALNCKKAYYRADRELWCFLSDDKYDAVMSAFCDNHWAMQGSFWGKPFKQFKEFPLLASFEAFMDERAPFFQQYSTTYKNRKNKIEYDIEFWKIPRCQAELQRDFLAYCEGRNDTMAYLSDPNLFRIQCLSVLDNYLTYQLRKTTPSIRSLTNDIMWEATDWIDALYVWLYCNIMSHEAYRTCPICGQEFRVGNHDTQKYCSYHTRDEVKSYKRKLNS